MCDKSPPNQENMEVEKTGSETTEELMDCGTPKHTLSDNSSLNSEPPTTKEEPSNGANDNDKGKSQLSDDIVMTESANDHETMQDESISEDEKSDKITYDDILLLCDLFYLPFEHGKQGLSIMTEFHWLKINAYHLSDIQATNSPKTEIQEWFERKEKFLKVCDSVFVLTRKIALCVNRELCHDLYTYCWEISTVMSICSSYVQWLALGKFPSNSNSYVQGSFTWFSKGWKETFMSGDQEPWIFRGGLVVDIQRLVPVDSGNDLFVYKLPETPVLSLFNIRPYINSDENEVYKICHQTCRDGSDCTELFPQSLQEIASDRLVAPFIILNPEFCMVIENTKKCIVGYACAAPDAKLFYRSQEVSF
jgi:protein O-GlcNAcase/histone acetyltransferase